MNISNNIDNFQRGQIVKIIGKDENYGKIGLIRYVTSDYIILDNMEIRNNSCLQVNAEKVNHCDDLNFLVKTKIALDNNIINFQSQIEKNSHFSNSYRITLSQEVYLKDQFEVYYGKQITDLISYIKFRNFENGKSIKELQEILSQLEVKVNV